MATIRYLDYGGLASYSELVRAYADDVGKTAQSYCDSAVESLDLTETLADYVTSSALAETLAGYATGSYVDDEIATAVSSAYEVKGSCELADLPEDAEVGDVYNIVSAFSTTSAFIEGEGAEYPAGTNVVYTSDGWDVLAGVMDLSGYVLSDDLAEALESYMTSSELTEMTEEDIAALFE